MKTIQVGTEFHKRLTNRDERQRDGTYTAVEFREKFLGILDDEALWKTDNPEITLDFKDVEKMGPSWTNEVFAYFTKYADPSRILKKIVIINISRVKMAIIEQELNAGYSRK